MPRLPDWNSGDALAATRLTEMQGPSNALLNANGSVQIGPNGITILNQFYRRNVAKAGYLADATSADETTEFETGEYVILTEQGQDAVDAEETQSFTVSTPDQDNYHRQGGIVVDPIGSDGAGSVMIMGQALARVKREIATSDTAGNALLTDGRAVARVEHTTTAGAANTTDPQILRVSFGAGAGDVIWEDEDETSGDLEQEHWALVNLSPKNIGSNLVEVTGEASGYTLFKFIEADGTVQGEEIALLPMDGDTLSTGDKALVVLTADGFVLKALGGGAVSLNMFQVTADGASGEVEGKNLAYKSNLALVPNVEQEGDERSVAYPVIA